MNTRSPLAIGTIAPTLLLSACASLSTPPSVGYVAEVNAAQQLRVCFRSGMPPPGQQVYFKYRRSYRSLQDTGTARIGAVGADGCAMASVLDGHPQRGVEVYLSRTDQRY